EEQLPAGVEADAERARVAQDAPALLDDAAHRLVPARGPQLPVVPHQRSGEPIPAARPRPGAVQTLRAQPAAVDGVRPRAPDADHAAVLDGDLAAAAVAAQHA